MAKKKTEETEKPVIAETETEEVVAAEVAESVEVAENESAETTEAPAEEKPIKKARASKAKKEVVVEPEQNAADSSKTKKRAEKIGIVASDKMTKTVVVRVDRQVKHPIYRKYVKRRKKFMAHDETGAKIGDKVKIVETRPLSARKRWRVVEIIQKAEL